MNFNQHLGLEGKHAFLSPSSHAWLNYDDLKLVTRYRTIMAARRGTDLHALAHEAIRLGVRLARAEQSLATYVADAIKYRMICEQPLFFSPNCFGTPDTIVFNRNKLRIHDLKTGLSATSMRQLHIYAALFCLEYQVNPYDIDVELRIYQREDLKIDIPHPDLIISIMEKIVDFDQRIEIIKEDL